MSMDMIGDRKIGLVRKFLLAGLASALCLLGATSSAGASHGDPFGAHFGLADAVGPAWPGSQALWAGTCDLADASTAAGGVGAPPPAFAHCIDVGVPYFTSPAVADPDPPRTTVWAPGGEPQWRLDPVSAAGDHPDATISTWLRRSSHLGLSGQLAIANMPDGDLKDVIVRLPAGLVGNPRAVPKCAAELLRRVPAECPPETQVGVLTAAITGANAIRQAVFPVWNVEPRLGKTAELMVSPGDHQAHANIPIVASARTDGDFGVDAVATRLPGGIPVLGQTITIWGVPWASSHDRYRAPVGYEDYVDGNGIQFGGMPEPGLPDPAGVEGVPYDFEWGPIRPFLTNPTECDPQAPVTTQGLTSWQDSDLIQWGDAPADTAVSGCAEVPFGPSMEIRPTSVIADGPSGLEVDLELPQNNDPPAGVATDPDDSTGAPAHWRSLAGRATAHLKRAVVTLPPGVTVNPSASSGLEGCSDAELGLGSNSAVTCPDGSKIGTVTVRTPLLDESLEGDLLLRDPQSTDPASGDMFRMAIVVESKERGLLVKLPGSAVADPDTGRLTATFDQNPRIPFSDLTLRLKAGSRAVLALPQDCGTPGYATELTPWTAEHAAGGMPAFATGAFGVTERCGAPFAPSLQVAMSSRRAGAPGRLAFVLRRPEGQEHVFGLTAELPTGLLASVRGVPLCGSAQAAAGACPATSRIGSVDAAAGSGTPFWIERKGDAYLTEGYKGAPYGLMVRVPVEAGPFRGQFALDPIVVRQALHVDRRSARVTVASDPLPTIHHGIPLRMREIRVEVDRPGFMRNPTDCSPKRVTATVRGVSGARGAAAAPFQAAACGGLGFKPKLAMRLTGKRQTKTGGHPGIRAVVKQPAGQAGIERVEVRLPQSLALDVDNAQALCEFADGTRPDLENHCPKGSVVGRARAVSPLLNRPLVGDVFFVKNVRIDPKTKRPIRTLPMIVVALRGEIAVNLRGESDVRRGRLVSTFAEVPDAPVSRFNLNIAGGRTGILVVTRTRRGRIDVCAKRQIAEADVDGHNGKRADQDVRVKAPCRKARQGRRAGHKR